MFATNKPFGLQLFSATIHQNPNTHTLLSSPHPTIHAPGNCITLCLCLSVCPLSLFLSVCLSVCLYTIRSSERRRACVDHSSRRSDEIDTLLLLLTRLHKRSPIEQHTEIRTRKKERLRYATRTRSQARDATTTPEQNNVIRKNSNKAQNLGERGSERNQRVSNFWRQRSHFGYILLPTFQGPMLAGYCFS
jgi:hypothetical protein